MNRQVFAVVSAFIAMTAIAIAIQREQTDPRDRLLGDIATNRVTLPAEEMTVAIRVGLADQNFLVRERALFAIAGRMVGRRTDRSPERAAQWQAERPILLSLKDDVIAALADVAPQVRAAAVFALVHLGDVSDGGDAKVRLDANTIAILADAYQKDSSVYNRSEILRHIALSEPDDSRQRRELILQGLSDPADGIVGNALRAAAAARMPEVLPIAARLLAHTSRNVRLEAVFVLATYGPEARGHVPSLRAQLERETDDVVRKTLQGTLQKLERIK